MAGSHRFNLVPRPCLLLGREPRIASPHLFLRAKRTKQTIRSDDKVSIKGFFAGSIGESAVGRCYLLPLGS